MGKLYTEKEILKAKTPTEYINRCHYSKVSHGRKTVVSSEWQKRTGYTIEDIKYARHRYPYWKYRKMEGGPERNRIRMKKYNFKTTPKYRWPLSQIKKFIKLNTKNEKGNGRYIYTDRELAKIFKTTIASIQAWRRKTNLINKLYDKLNTRKTKREEYLAQLLQSCELILRAELYAEKPSIHDIIKKQRNRKHESEFSVF